MIAKQIIAATLVAAVLTLLFYFGSRPYDRRERLVLFFLIVFGAAMTAGHVLNPVGPQFQGVNWLPFLGAGVLSALLTMLLQARNLPLGRESTTDKLERGAWVQQIQRATSRLLRLLFGVVATMWMIGLFIRLVR